MNEHFPHKDLNQRILLFDLIRFLAILLIYLHHYCKTIGIVYTYNMAAVLGIFLFVFISSYLTVAVSSPENNPISWLKRKFLKILLPYWLIFHVLLVINFFLQFKKYKYLTYPYELIGLQLFIHPLYDATWFISYILIFYAIIAAVYLIGKMKYMFLTFFFADIYIFY